MSRLNRSNRGPIGLSAEALELIAARFRVLGEANRLRLIQALNGRERNVTELTEATGLAQANASRHLQTLAEAGILRRRRSGVQVLYSIADPSIFNLCEHVCGGLQKTLRAHAKALVS